jgi:hypothetical protein
MIHPLQSAVDSKQRKQNAKEILSGSSYKISQNRKFEKRLLKKRIRKQKVKGKQ